MTRRISTLTALLACAGIAAALQSSGPTVTLSFSTYFGGSGGGTLREVAFDSAGNIVVTGHGAGYTTGVFPTARTFGPLGADEICVAKFSPSGALLWATLVGGSGQDRGYGVALDPAGNIYVAGQTSSLDFPTTAGAWDRTNNGGGSLGPHGSNLDAHVFKLSPDGSQLLYSTYLGGSGIDGARGGLAVDSAGAAYVVGFTGSSDFLNEGGVANPARVNSYRGGVCDAFITKVNPAGSGIVYSRYLGGSNDTVASGEVAAGAAVDAQGRATVHAIVRSTDAATTSGAFDSTFNGGESDPYFAQISADGTQLLYATYFGGSGNEFGEHRMAIDAAGNAYFSGFTDSPNFPTMNAQQGTPGGGGDGFLVKLGSTGQPVFSTYVGGSGSDSFFGPTLDGAGRIFIAGPTTSPNFPVTSGATQASLRGTQDVGILVYSSSGQLLYATYFGGAGSDGGRWAGAEPQGGLVVVGETGSADLPTTPGAYDASLTGSGNAFVTRFALAWPSTSPGSLRFSQSSYTVGEAAGQATIAVQRTGGSSGAVSVNYGTTNGSAVSGSDYASTSGTLLWNDGDSSSKTFSVPVIDHPAVEPNETVLLSLASPGGGATLGSPSSATLMIVDDDSALPAPVGPAALPGDGRVTLAWSAVSGAASYTVYMASAPGVTRANWSFLPGGMSHPNASSPFVHAGLANGTTYFFVVTASNASGESGESVEVSATPSASGWPIPDADGDGYSDLAELSAGSNPNDPLSTPVDTDGDGMADAWEQAHFGGLSALPADDPDGDGANHLVEYNAGTDPGNPDTDGDGHSDGAEIAAGSAPLDPASVPGGTGGGGGGGGGGGCGATGMEFILLAGGSILLRKRRGCLRLRTS